MAAAAAEGMPAPLRPTKELYQEKSLNLADAWARVYLARGCGAVVHSRVGERNKRRHVTICNLLCWSMEHTVQTVLLGVRAHVSGLGLRCRCALDVLMGGLGWCR
jgi:hypothetical protein